jgi:hypothetical protein
LKAVFGYLRRHHIGLLALFFALSGTAYAATVPRNSVGTSQLKRNAVTSAKVRDGSLLATDFRAGQIPRGPAGPQGPAGPAGPQGATGAAGPAGRNAVTSIAVRVSSPVLVAAAGGTATATVSCAPGEVAVGGGGITANHNAQLTDSFSTPAAGTPTGWGVHYRNDQPASDTVVAEVICATP